MCYGYQIYNSLMNVFSNLSTLILLPLLGATLSFFIPNNIRLIRQIGLISAFLAFVQRSGGRESHRAFGPTHFFFLSLGELPPPAVLVSRLALVINVNEFCFMLNQ
jgi:hypothetical protein